MRQDEAQVQVFRKFTVMSIKSHDNRSRDATAANKIKLSGQEALVIQDARSIATENVAKEDYQQQVDRWNRYQEQLDKIQHRCEIENFPFERRLTTSYSERRMKAVVQGIGIGLLFATGYCLWLVSDAIINGAVIGNGDFMTGAVLSMGTAAVAAALLTTTRKLPETIKFACKPVLFIDDRYYLQKFVRGLARERNDPEVVLPALTMELPHSWIKQQSLLKGMETMSDAQTR